jgi:AsmA protein
VQNVTVADDPAFSAEPFLRVPSLQVNVEFLPLLWQEVRVSRLVLRAPEVTVIRDKKGRLNVTSLGPTGAREEGPTKAEQEAEPPSRRPPWQPFRSLSLSWR